MWSDAAVSYCLRTPAERLFRSVLYWGSIVMASLIILFTVYHIQTVPDHIHQAIMEQLTKRPWVRDLVIIDGRNVYLQGTVEPDSALEDEIAIIRSTDGVRSVINLLDEHPKPTAFITITKTGKNLALSGKMAGDHLEQLIDSIKRHSKQINIQDRIQIDDRLGRPLWLAGFDESLLWLIDLDDFEFFGWRNQIQVSGLVETEKQYRAIEYSMPISFISSVLIDNRLRSRTTDGFAPVSLVSDWSGTTLQGYVPSDEHIELLEQSMKRGFGDALSNSTLATDFKLYSTNEIEKLSELLPKLSVVRNLRIESSGSRFTIWGDVDDPYQLGGVLHSVDTLNMTEMVNIRISINAADTPASLSLFTDHSRAIITGTLPSIKSKETIVKTLKSDLGVNKINDLTTTEPNISNSHWIEIWPSIVSLFPTGAVGLTITDQHILLSGTVHDPAKYQAIDSSLAALFPQHTRLNWVKLIDNVN